VFKFLTDRSIIVNVLVIIFLVIILVFVFFSSLDWITSHGKYKKVPTVIGQNISAATQLLKSQGFNVEVQDSVYIDSIPKSSVLRQSPEADAEVKEHRTIYLTVNRAVAPLIDMPDLRGFSFLSAKLFLQSLGLKLGDTSYRPDIARNSVLEQSIDKRFVAPGTKVSMGSSINLVLGDGVGNAQMNVPEIVGMSFGEARDYLTTMNIGLGAVIPNSDVKDKENAFVYRQNPEKFTLSPSGEKIKNLIRPGQVVDIWLSVMPPITDTTTIGQIQPPTP
jgi:beta-lactam-binding protein with PASTA domain